MVSKDERLEDSRNLTSRLKRQYTLIFLSLQHDDQAALEKRGLYHSSCHAWRLPGPGDDKQSELRSTAHSFAAPSVQYSDAGLGTPR